MDLQPLGDRLIVEVPDEEETTFSGIVLPDTAKEKPQRGCVLRSAGYVEQTGVHSGSTSPMARGIFSKYGGTESRSVSTSFILRESDVLAKVVSTGAKGKSKKARRRQGLTSNGGI
jgi:chaperonin GroES